MMRTRSALRFALSGVMASLVVATTFLPAPLAALQQPAQQDVAAQIAAARAVLAKESYTVPPPEIVRLATAPRHLNVALNQPSPDRKYFLKEQSEGLPSIAVFGKLHLYLGGLQVDPKANRSRSLTTRGAMGLQLIESATGKSSAIETPKGAQISGATWSPDGKQLAYVANFDAASHVFVADIATGKSTQITKTPLLATLVTSVDWTVDGKSVIGVMIPEPRQPEPRRDVATGPQVRVWTEGVKAPSRNYWSLLEDPTDQALLEYYTTGQLAVIDVKSKAVKKIGAPAMIQSATVSPDGLYFRVTTMQKPFSYVVQYSSFGTNEELWDATGKVLSQIAKRPLREGPADTSDAAGGGGRAGGEGAKRSLAWMPQGSGMYYLEAVPGRRGADSGDAGAAAAPTGRGAGRGGAGGAAPSRPDRLVRWNPPFGAGDTTVLYRAEGPMGSMLFTDDAKMIFVGTTSGGSGEVYAVKLDEPTSKLTVLRQRGYQPSFGGGGRGRGGGGGGRGGGADDSLTFYNNPGSLLAKRGSVGGQVVMLSSDSSVFFQGTQYSRDWAQAAPREFLDKVQIRTGSKTRVFEGAADAFEQIGAPLDDDYGRAIVTRESKTTVPDAFVRDMKTGTLTRLTNNKDYTPEFTSAVRRRIKVTRPDSINFMVNVTLPAGYRDGTRLPAMFWFYPGEFTEQAGYDRTLRTENVNRFPNGGARTIEYLITQGYAVVNFNPPIMGETGRMNDNYVPDLRMNLYAVIEELDRQGIIDRARLGLGGHSYGAFSTVNAMVQTPFFKAGIAGDGMYNRTLTPNGFQSERRDLWDGKNTYLEMSPMLSADRLSGALLMYHSLEDQNVGTDPISSIRMMQALRAHGKTASLYLYPYEDHGPATKESDLDQWARWVAWLDIYVKHAGEAKKPSAAANTTMQQPSR